MSSAELCANACTENNECTAFSYKASTGRCLLQNSGDRVDLEVHVESKQFRHYVADAGCATTTTTTDQACTETGLECNMQAAVDTCCEGTWCQEGLFGGNSVCLPDFALIEGQLESTTEAAMTTISLDTTDSPDLEDAMTGTVAHCILDKYEGPIVEKRAKSANVISITSDVADEESCAQLCNSVADEECLGFSYRADREKCSLVNTAGTDGKTICIYF